MFSVAQMQEVPSTSTQPQLFSKGTVHVYTSYTGYRRAYLELYVMISSIALYCRHALLKEMCSITHSVLFLKRNLNG